MRQIATFPREDKKQADLFADYLQSLAISSHLDLEEEGWLLWIRDEDKVAQAREELDRFREKPNDTRYVEGAQIAQVKRAQKAKVEAQLRRKEETFERRRSTIPERRLTLGLIGISIIVSLMFGDSRRRDDGSPSLQDDVARWLFIVEVDPYKNPPYSQQVAIPEVREGQVWRLITPIFIHFSGWHLLGNMFWLFILGSQIETRESYKRLLLLVLVIAVLSNLGQYFLSRFWFQGGSFHIESLKPLFGGMSGVVFGLFGYVWMKSRFQPSIGYFLTNFSVILMLFWLLLCMTGQIGRIANTAHVVGLLVGLIWGYYGAWWHSRR